MWSLPICRRTESEKFARQRSWTLWQRAAFGASFNRFRCPMSLSRRHKPPLVTQRDRLRRPMVGDGPSLRGDEAEEQESPRQAW
jgi:hypothetical protein